MSTSQYPIGRLQIPASITEQDIQRWKEEIRLFPGQFTDVARKLTLEQLETPYRQHGWTARQVIHHVPDSHLNAYIRFKWTLTENHPRIKAYDEAAWAALPDAISGAIDAPLMLLQATHLRWLQLMDSMQYPDFKRTYEHPENGKTYTLGAICCLYAWHGAHHLAHLNLIRNQGAED